MVGVAPTENDARMNEKLPQLIKEVMTIIQAQTGLIPRLRLAMQSVYGHPDLRNEYEGFLVAVTAVFLISDDTEQAAIQSHVKGIAKICKFIQACERGEPVEFPDMAIPQQRLGLLTLWSSIKEEVHAHTRSQTHQYH